MTEAQEVAILNSICAAINRLPDGQTRPAEGLVMAIDARDTLDPGTVAAIGAIFRDKYALLLEDVSMLGYHSMALVGHTAEDSAILWSREPLSW